MATRTTRSDPFDLTHTPDPNYVKFSPTGTWTVDTNPTHDNSYYERFKGHGNGASLTMKSDVNLSIVPPGQASIHWDQAAVFAQTDLFNDPATNSNFSADWTNGGDWGYNSNSYEGQQGSSGPDLTLKTTQNLSACSAVTLSWDWKSDAISPSQGLNVYVTDASGNFVSTPIDGFTGAKSQLADQNLCHPLYVPPVSASQQKNGAGQIELRRSCPIPSG